MSPSRRTVKIHSVYRKSKVQNGVHSKVQDATICGGKVGRGYLDIHICIWTEYICKERQDTHNGGGHL